MQLALTPERAKAIKLWILIPCRHLACLSPHHTTLMGMLRSHNIWYKLVTMPGDSLVTRARNNLADVFLRESTDDDNHLALWLDDDIYFNPESVLQMLSLTDRHDFLAAPYTKKALHMDRLHAAAVLGWKSQDIESVGGTANVNYLLSGLRLDEPVPVLEAGSGFWLHRRKVLRMMVDYLPDIRFKRTVDETGHYGCDHAHDFFKVGVWPETKEYLSEDWWFCRQWRALGGTVHCCFWVPTQHLGHHMYPMNMNAIAGLLSETGGAIYGNTWGDNVEVKAPRGNGAGNGTGRHDGGNGDPGRDGGVIARVARDPVSRPPSEATVAGDPGPLGG